MENMEILPKLLWWNMKKSEKVNKMPWMLNYFKMKNESSQKHSCVISNDSVSYSTKKKLVYRWYVRLWGFTTVP